MFLSWVLTVISLKSFSIHCVDESYVDPDQLVSYKTADQNIHALQKGE